MAANSKDLLTIGSGPIHPIRARHPLGLRLSSLCQAAGRPLAMNDELSIGAVAEASAAMKGGSDRRTSGSP